MVSEKESGLSGEWKFYFTYSNDTSLVYRGDLHLEENDSLVLNFQIKAPRSARAEQIQASNVVKTANGVEGRLIYDRFKIRGGYLSEYFNLIFDEKDKFSGQGKCIEYCAEGTEDATIEWHGSRVNN